MASNSVTSGLSAALPGFSKRGAGNSLLLEVKDMGPKPVAGRLLRGFTPFLFEDGVQHIFLSTYRRRKEPWSATPNKIVPYQELVHWDRTRGTGGAYRGLCFTEDEIAHKDIVQAFEHDPFHLLEWAARRVAGAIVSSTAPWPLEQCFTEKPWGREGWYTGIEARGVSRVAAPSGSTALPYALGMFPVPVVGESESPPILLKTLEPLPEPVLGDLYLEVHREKWETYVVMEVDPTAWPKGKGILRAGLNPNTIKKYTLQFGDDWQSQISEDLKASIAAYELVRRRLDALIDTARQDRGEDPDTPTSAGEMGKLLAALPKKDQDEEARRRKEVEAFLGKIPLRPGDVVSLPPGVLHSLQHGIKVMEFQTPTYERLIAMFAQKVLTQAHWDTDAAIDLTEKAPYSPSEFQMLAQEEGYTIEEIVSFPQFKAQRLRLEPKCRCQQETGGNGQYALLVGLTGKGSLQADGEEPVEIFPGSAYLLPATMGQYTLEAHTNGAMTVIQAIPVMVNPSEEDNAPVDWEAAHD